jgi:hypothetical protein
VSIERPDVTRVVVVLDNLDRLGADEALRTLGEVRSLFEIPNSRCVFLVPVDQGALTKQLAPVLGNDETSRDYLEKFFNAQIEVASPGPVDLRSWTESRVGAAFEGAIGEDEVRAVTQVLSLAGTGSPRTIVRLINSVATRWRVLVAAASSTTVEQVAFVEGLGRFPWMREVLVREPRRFLEARLQILSRPDTEAVLAPLWQHVDEQETTHRFGGQLPSEVQIREFVTFLLACAYIPLTLGELREIKALRTNDTWRGVEDPEGLEASLVSGQQSLLEAVLPADTNARRTALDRSLDWVRTSWQGGYLIDALNGFNAMFCVETRRSPSEALRSIGLDLLSKRGHEALLQMSDATRTALVGNSVSSSDLIIRSVTAGLEQQQYGEPRPTPDQLTKLVSTLRQLDAAGIQAPDTTLHQIASIRYQLEALQTLYDAPAAKNLILGPVSSAYAKDLAGWSPETEGEPTALAAARRLVIAADHGWEDQTALDGILANAAGQVQAVISDRSHEILGFVVELASRFPPSAATDGLARALVARGSGWTVVKTAMAFDLPIGQEARADVLDQVASAALSDPPEITSELLRSLATSATEPLARVLTSALTAWARTGNDDLGQAILSVTAYEALADSVIEALRAVPASGYWERLADAIELLPSGRRAGMPTNRLAEHAASAIDISTKPGQGALRAMRALSDRRANFRPFRSRIAAFVEGATSIDEPLIAWARTIEELDPGTASQISNAFAEKVPTLAIVPEGVGNLLATVTPAARERMLKRSVRRIQTATDDRWTKGFTDALVGEVGPANEIALALARSAATADCDYAMTLVQLAMRWSPPEETADDLDSLLQSVRERCPGS